MSNKIKEFINNKYGLLIVVSWSFLLIFLIIKLFGGNWFELGIENSRFITFCNFVDEHIFLKRLLAILICLGTTLPVYLIMLNDEKPKWYILVILSVLTICKSVLSWFNSTLSFIMDIIILLGVITIFNKKPLRNIICFVIVTIFQLMTIGIRNISFWLGGFNLGNTFIEQLLIQVDYYIMILLFYLYNFKKKKKEVE